MLLTLSIALLSVTLPLSVNAQNNALSQNGGGAAKHEIEQGQSLLQDNQIVSGDSSILSGNNLLCRNQDNSIGISSFCPPIEVNDPEIIAGELRIEITRNIVHIPPSQDNSCISPYGEIIVTIRGFDTRFPATNCNGEHLVYKILLPIGEPYQIRAVAQNIPSDLIAIDARISDQNGGRDCSGINRCGGVMTSEDGVSINVQFRFLDPR